LGNVAEQRSVANVAVLQQHAVKVFLALARHAESNAVALGAFVIHGTRVPVVAGKGVGVKNAAARGVATVGGAQISVVAVDGRTDAFACIAVVGQGAHIFVVTRRTGKRLVQASRFRVTAIFGTLVAIVANPGRSIISAFVNLAVAIVINAVADLFGRCGRGTWGQTFGIATTNARAQTPLVLDMTSGDKTQFYRSFRT